MLNISKWENREGKLTKIVSLNSFKEVIVLVNKIAQLAEKQNHHPDLEIFGYKNLKIKISTHDVSDITDKDYELAKAIDKLFQ